MHIDSNTASAPWRAFGSWHTVCIRGFAWCCMRLIMHVIHANAAAKYTYGIFSFLKQGDVACCDSFVSCHLSYMCRIETGLAVYAIRCGFTSHQDVISMLMNASPAARDV
jgi:hypothetical protein